MNKIHKVGTYEAKTHLPHLLEQVGKGDRFTITKHGVPVAMLVPIELADKPDIQKAIDELLIFGRKHPLKKMSIRALADEGRRA